MSKMKLVGIKNIVVDGRDILQTRYVDKPEACKECKRAPRVQASARCQGCTNSFRLKKFQDQRLEDKINKQIKK